VSVAGLSGAIAEKAEAKLLKAEEREATSWLLKAASPLLRFVSSRVAGDLESTRLAAARASLSDWDDIILSSVLRAFGVMERSLREAKPRPALVASVREEDAFLSSKEAASERRRARRAGGRASLI
jgi:hypothetical protein